MILGTTLPTPHAPRPPQIVCDDPRLRPHLHRPWLNAWLAQRLDGAFAEEPSPLPQNAEVPESALARNGLYCGTIGNGKSSAMRHVITEHLQQGGSAIIIDPKGDTARHCIARAKEAGFPAERVTLIQPGIPGGLPGFNPLATGLSVTESAGDLHAILARSKSASYARMDDLIVNVLTLAAAHRLSLYEATRLLLRPDYLEALLRLPPEEGRSLAYSEAHAFFQEEYLVWSKSARSEANGPVLNKLRELLRNEGLAPMICAGRQTLDLARFWQEPRVLIVHLDVPALGDMGAALLAGMLASQLFRTSLRASGPVPVLLGIDELPVVERFCGTALQDILSMARSQNLRLMVATQHFDQISPSLQAALLANAAVQCYFHLSHADARSIAASLAAGTSEHVTRLRLDVDGVDRRTGQATSTLWRHAVYDAWGCPLRLTPEQLAQLRQRDLFGGDAVRELYALAQASGYDRLYIKAADSGQPVELRRYVKGLSSTDFWVDGPCLELVVRFPRPRLSGVERSGESDAVRGWVGVLQDLPIRHCVLQLAGRTPQIVRVVDVPDCVWTPEIEAYAEKARRANGQTAEEVQSTRARRLAQLERIARGQSEAAADAPAEQPASEPGAMREMGMGSIPEEDDDGSLF